MCNGFVRSDGFTVFTCVMVLPVAVTAERYAEEVLDGGGGRTG